jgi:iron complex outermembrane receptor protein
MTNALSRSRLTSATSHFAVAVMLVSASPAWAQDPQPTTADAQAAAAQAAAVDASAQSTDDQTEATATGPASPEGASPTSEADQGAIVITGFRASLQNAVNKKKNSEQIVESVSAEDIGKLPDASIGEAIARLPGLTSQRLSGRADVISIRGFGPDYSTTLLNGREQTSQGDNRAVQFDQYPAEIINQVNVYKTPMASIIGQGISGTVDLRTIRPLEYGKRVISVGGRIVASDMERLNPEAKKYGYRVNGVYVDQFADGNLGVSLAASYNNEPYQVKEFNAWGYADAPGGSVVIGGLKPYSTSTQLKRLGLAGTIEFKPMEYITSTVDGFYSNFKDEQIKRGIEIPLQWGGGGEALQPGFTTSDGVVTSGTFTGVNPVVRNVAQPRKAKLYSFGWNNRYDGPNGWRGFFDLSYSKTDRNELVFETYAGTGYNFSGARDTMGFTTGKKGTTLTHLIDYSDPNQIVVTDPRGWGGTAPNGAIRPGYYNNRIVDDRIWQFHPELSKDLETGFLSRLTLGANWTDHKKSLTPDEFFVQFSDPNMREFVLNDELHLGSVDLGYLGLGDSIAYDPFDLLDAGIYTLVSNNENLDVRAKAYDVNEKLGTVYAKLDIKSHLGAADLTGNVGVQAVHTNQRTNGYFAQNGVISPISDGAKYWDVMPSLNLAARWPSDWVIRVGLAREVMRPRMDSMRLGLSYGLCLQGCAPTAVLSGSSGNPQLRPFRANAADFSVEKYFGIKGYVSAQMFYKYFDTFVVEQNLPGQPFDYTGFPLPASVQTTDPTAPNYLPPVGITNGVIFQPYNVKGGKLYGIELASTLPLGEFVPALDGFGLTGGVSYTKSKIKIYADAPPSDLPGYSKWVANGTAYFEKWGFSARASVRHRSSFRGEVSGFAANRVFRRADAETILDGQIGYEFQPYSPLRGLSIYLQGMNLTNEPFVTRDPQSTLRVIDYQRFGRRFMLGANYKFGAAAPRAPAPAPVILPPPPPPVEVAPPAPPPPPPPAPVESGERGR